MAEHNEPERQQPIETVQPAVSLPPEGVTPQMRLQMLTAEHSSLSVTRAMIWNEVFSRTSMFLTSLSAAIVAIALAGQGTGFGASFVLFALIVLPVVLFLGFTTFIRLAASNYHDAQCVIGMNRIRAAYLELAPDLERYLVMGAHDDPRGIGITMGSVPGGIQILQLFAATAGVAAVMNAVICGAVVGLAVHALNRPIEVSLIAAAAAFVVAFAMHMVWGRRAIVRAQRGAVSRFPSPPTED